MFSAKSLALYGLPMGLNWGPMQALESLESIQARISRNLVEINVLRHYINH